MFGISRHPNPEQEKSPAAAFFVPMQTTIGAIRRRRGHQEVGGTLADGG
jgi:hypothetical protein